MGLSVMGGACKEKLRNVFQRVYHVRKGYDDWILDPETLIPKILNSQTLSAETGLG